MRTIHANRSENNFPHPILVGESIKKFDLSQARYYRSKDVLVERLASHHNFPEKRIFLGEGGLGIIDLVLSSCLRKNPTILLPQFGYVPYHQIAEREEAKIDRFAFKEENGSFYYDLADLFEKLAKKPGLLVIIDPESPLGFSIRSKDLEDILRKVPSSTMVLLDQAHEGMRTSNVKDINRLLSEYPNLMVLRSFSKLYGLASLRVGYALAGEEAIKHIKLPLGRLGFPSISQDIAISALDSQAEYGEMAKKIRLQKARLNHAMRMDLGYTVYLTDGLYCVAKVPQNQTAFINAISEKSDIRVRDYSTYYYELRDIFGAAVGPEDITSMLIDLFQSASFCASLDRAKLTFKQEGYFVNKVVPEPEDAAMGFLHVVILPSSGEKLNGVPVHQHHQQWEKFIFQSDAILILNGTNHSVKAGDVVEVNPRDFHGMFSLPEKFARFIAQRWPYSDSDSFRPDGSQR